MTRLVVFATVMVVPAVAHADPAGDLKALGQRVLHDLDAAGGGSFDAAPGGIVAVGGCVRPTTSQRDALTSAVRASAGQPEVAITFGCVDRNGIVIDVHFDRVEGGRPTTGVWRVQRASAPTSSARLTTLAEHVGEAEDNWMEWSNEVTVRTLALADLDGDGVRDVIIERHHHEGGARHSDVAVSVWRSTTGKVTEAGTFSDHVAIVGDHVPFVIAITGDTPDQLRLRCLESTGVIDVCPAVVAMRHLARQHEIADWFVQGHAYGPFNAPLPDRELAATLLDELGIAKPAQAQLVAEMPKTLPEVRVAREIERLVAPPVTRQFGEIVDTPVADLRPSELVGLLGDSPCATTPADTRRLADRVAAWIRANDAAIVRARKDDCGGGGNRVCTWTKPTAPEVTGACIDATRGYVVASWRYVDQGLALVRDALFVVRGPAVELAVSTGTVEMVMPCAACGGPDTRALSATLYRHGASLIALVDDGTNTPDHRASPLRTFVDGTPVGGPASDATWYRFREPDALVGSVVEVAAPTGFALYHHDGTAWTRLVELASTPGPMPAGLSPAATYLWRDWQRWMARNDLRSFDAHTWARDPGVRAALRASLEHFGADAATLARIDAEAAATEPRRSAP